MSWYNFLSSNVFLPYLFRSASTQIYCYLVFIDKGMRSEILNNHALSWVRNFSILGIILSFEVIKEPMYYKKSIMKFHVKNVLFARTCLNFFRSNLSNKQIHGIKSMHYPDLLAFYLQHNYNRHLVL